MRSLLCCTILATTVCLSACSAFGQERKSPSEYVATVIAQALTTNGTAPSIQQVPRSSADVRRVVSTNLSPKLLMQSLELSGMTYRFVEPKSSEEVTVIVFRYPSSEVCAKKMRSLEPLKRAFSKSEMLVRFSATQLGTLLVLASSENSGDARIVHTLDSLPERFAADTKNRNY